MLQGFEPSRSSSSAAAPSDVLQIAASVRGIHSDIHSHPQVISAEKALQLTAQLICRKSRCFTNQDKFFCFPCRLLRDYFLLESPAVKPLEIQSERCNTAPNQKHKPIRKTHLCLSVNSEPESTNTAALRHQPRSASVNCISLPARAPASSAYGSKTVTAFIERSHVIWRFASCRVAALARSRNASHVHSPRR